MYARNTVLSTWLLVGAASLSGCSDLSDDPGDAGPRCEQECDANETCQVDIFGLGRCVSPTDDIGQPDGVDTGVADTERADTAPDAEIAELLDPLEVSGVVRAGDYRSEVSVEMSSVGTEGLFDILESGADAFRAEVQRLRTYRLRFEAAQHEPYAFELTAELDDAGPTTFEFVLAHGVRISTESAPEEGSRPTNPAVVNPLRDAMLVLGDQWSYLVESDDPLGFSVMTIEGTRADAYEGGPQLPLFSPDGTLGLIAGRDALYLVDGATGLLAGEIDGRIDLDQVAFAANARRAALRRATAATPSDGGPAPGATVVIEWGGDGAAAVAEIAAAGRFDQLSPDGRTLVRTELSLVRTYDLSMPDSPGMDVIGGSSELIRGYPLGGSMILVAAPVRTGGGPIPLRCSDDPSGCVLTLYDRETLQQLRIASPAFEHFASTESDTLVYFTRDGGRRGYRFVPSYEGPAGEERLAGESTELDITAVDGGSLNVTTLQAGDRVLLRDVSGVHLINVSTGEHSLIEAGSWTLEQRVRSDQSVFLQEQPPCASGDDACVVAVYDLAAGAELERHAGGGELIRSERRPWATDDDGPGGTNAMPIEWSQANLFGAPCLLFAADTLDDLGARESRATYCRVPWSSAN